MEFYKEEAGIFNNAGKSLKKRTVASDQAPLFRKERNQRPCAKDASVFCEQSFQDNAPAVLIPGLKPEV